MSKPFTGPSAGAGQREAAFWQGRVGLRLKATEVAELRKLRYEDAIAAQKAEAAAQS